MKALPLLFTALALATASISAGEPLVVAGLKLAPVPFDKEGNYAKFEKYAREAAAAGAQLVITSECYLDGYVGNPKLYPELTQEKFLAFAEPVDGEYVRRAAALARELKIHLVFGFSERRGSETYNTAALISPEGAVLGRYSKSHLGEEMYSPGGELPVWDTAAGHIGLLICADRQLPETSRVLALKGAQMILVPTNSRNVEVINEDIMMRIRAYENKVFVALVSPFNTLMVNPEGEIIAHDNVREHEGVLLARFDLSMAAGQRDSLSRRRPELYRDLATAP
ncbi:MAG TPA: carbon-nitrogen hydrolase family protein [Opitutaceae bacterium]